MVAGIAIGVGLAIAGVGSYLGGKKAADGAKKQAEMQNQASERQLAYDTELWEMSKEKIIADREFAVQQTEIQALNEGKIAAYRDASNLQKYNYDMMIRNREQNSLNQQFLRSDDIFHKQITLNALTASAGREDELRKYQEIQAEASFDYQERSIENMQAEGTARARGVSGRTAAKMGQAIYADFGRRTAMVNESLASAGRNTRSVLKEIARDKASADLAAYAQKMLDPGVLPEPIRPFATPTSTYLYPRPITPGDFVPQPVLGALASPSAAANMVWGATISSAAGAIGGAAITGGIGAIP